MDIAIYGDTSHDQYRRRRAVASEACKCSKCDHTMTEQTLLQFIQSTLMGMALNIED